MAKLHNKLLQSVKKSSGKSEQPLNNAAKQRVTNDSVAKHRDEILSKGRRFKYPFSQSKHRVALISVTVVVFALVVLTLVTSLRLYKWQTTDDFTYRTTQIIPFPVAKQDGHYVAYENYLFELRYSLYWQQQFGTTDLRSPDGKRQIEYFKRQALDRALTNSITYQLAKKNNISVESKEVDSRIASIKTTSGDRFNQILSNEFGFGEDEVRRGIHDNILRNKVAKKLDNKAPKRAQSALNELKTGKPFADVARQLSDDLETKQLGGDVGIVQKNLAKLPNEVSNILFKLEVGKFSEVIKTTSNYYIVSVAEKVDENRVKASIIRIDVKGMNDYLKDYKNQNKIKEYIKLNEIAPQHL